MSKPKIYSNHYEINTGDKIDDVRAKAVAELADKIQQDKVEINELAGRIPMSKSASYLQSMLIERRKQKKYMWKIIDTAPNPNLDALLSLFAQQKFDAPFTGDEITSINNTIRLEPENFFKTRYITPGIELINNFLVTRTHPDSPELYAYMSIPLRYWDDIDVQVIDKTVMTDTDSTSAWIAMSNSKNNRLQMFNPTKPIHVVRNEIAQLAIEIIQGFNDPKGDIE